MNSKQIIRLLITLVILWCLLSGMFKPLLIGLGVLSILLVCYLSVKMKILSHQGQALYFPFFSLFLYWFWLIIEIFKSNIAVAKRVMDPAMPIDPVLRAIPAPQKTEIGKVIFANSITLTPGTVALNIIQGNEILVHALDKGELDDLEQGEMSDRVTRLEPSILASEES